MGRRVRAPISGKEGQGASRFSQKSLGSTWIKPGVRAALAVSVPLMYLLEQDHSGATFQEENLTACVLDLLLAGTETTSTTIRWALLYMATHPEIQGTLSKRAVVFLGFSPHSF